MGVLVKQRWGVHWEGGLICWVARFWSRCVLDFPSWKWLSRYSWHVFSKDFFFKLIFAFGTFDNFVSWGCIWVFLSFWWIWCDKQFRIYLVFSFLKMCTGGVYYDVMLCFERKCFAENPGEDILRNNWTMPSLLRKISHGRNLSCISDTFAEILCSQGIRKRSGEEDRRQSLGSFCKHEWARSPWGARSVLCHPARLQVSQFNCLSGFSFEEASCWHFYLPFMSLIASILLQFCKMCCHSVQESAM